MGRAATVRGKGKPHDRAALAGGTDFEVEPGEDDQQLGPGQIGRACLGTIAFVGCAAGEEQMRWDSSSLA